MQALSQISDKAAAKLRSFRWKPRTRVARFTLYVAGMALLLRVLELVFKLAGATATAGSLHSWYGFLSLLFWVLAVFLGLRWFRAHVMWSVRNRLIVSYLFTGVVPVALVLILTWLSTNFLIGRFSDYLAVSAIETQAEHLQAANTAAAQLLAKGGVSVTALQKLSSRNDPDFPEKTLQVVPASLSPGWLKDSFHGLVYDHGQMYLRAAKVVNVGPQSLAVISSVPVDQQFVSHLASALGKIRVYIPKPDARVNVNLSPREIAVSGGGSELSAGSLAPPRSRWDWEIRYPSLIGATDWGTGKFDAESDRLLLIGRTRSSTLLSRLVHTSPEGATSFGQVVAIVLAVFAAIIVVFVLIAWLIGFRLMRTITYSVANLYRATQQINRGDFTHRIQVRENDQLAALQTSFNSMTESLQKLIAEQKEKERLQSELEIAHEVQAQLFPQAASGTRTLELHGVCRPARIVSGDYYDFLAYGPEQMGIAVGDISGKGISAALLMATIHSAVRAYEQELLAPVSATVAGDGSSARAAMVAPRVARPSPAQMLWLLNRHLYQSTQPEKYATLFLGFYDDADRRLTYSNAGHLPPVILGEDGSTRRLETGGTVVGLFDDRGYEEQTVQLHPGDMFIAFSDGMTEPENEFGEFGEERLVETVAAHRHLPLDRISEHAIAAVQDWIGSSEQPDDVTLVLARRIG